MVLGISAKDLHNISYIFVHIFIASPLFWSYDIVIEYKTMKK